MLVPRGVRLRWWQAVMITVLVGAVALLGVILTILERIAERIADRKRKGGVSDDRQ